MKDGKKNGAGVVGAPAPVVTSPSSSVASPSPSPSPPPQKEIADLAEACVRFVERAVGVKLDYEPETLPLLDHYIEQARAAVKEKPETLSLVVETCGAYLGEVVRRRHAAWWRTDGGDATEWQVELEAVFLAVSPMKIILAALLRPGTEGAEGAEGGEGTEGAPKNNNEEEEEPDLAQLTLEEEDRVAVAERLAELPQVSEQEFYAPSTRLEVIDIAVEAIRARRLAAGEDAEVHLTPADYD